jgi:hypothetical protein
MFTNPGITADVATQDRELTSTQARPMARRVVASLVAAAAATAVLLTSPVGTAHLATQSGTSHFRSGTSHFRSGTSHFQSGTSHFQSGTSHFQAQPDL